MSDQEGGVIRNKPRKRPGGPGRPAAGEELTPNEIAEAAVQLVLLEGEAALTMRRLGEMLGVKAMALYNHFPYKEAILDAVAGLALERVPLPPAKGSWKHRVKAMCRGIRGMALEHPKLFRVAMTRPMPPMSVLPQVEFTLSALADAGLSPAAQAVAYQTLRLYVRGYCLWEIEELNQGGDLARLTASGPHTAAAARFIFKPDPERQFEAGLDLILHGLRADDER